MNTYVRRCLIIPFLVLLIQSSVFGQARYKEGYIIQSNSDTIRGQVKYSLKENKGISLFFKPEKRSPETKLTPEDIQGFGFDDFNHYVPLNLTAIEGFGHNYFARVLITGKFSLYAVEDGYIVDKNDQFSFLPKKVESGEGNANLRQLARKLGGLVGDCSKPLFDNLKSSLSESAIIRIAKGYNQCINSDYQILSYDETLPGFGIQIGISAGIGISNYSLGTDNNIDLSSVNFEATSSTVLGASILLYSPRFSRGAGLFLGFQHQKLSAYGSERPGFTPGSIARDVFLDTDIKRLFTGLSFSKRKKILDYYLRGGLSFNSFDSIESRMISDHISSDAFGAPLITRFESEPTLIRNAAGFGFWLSLGIQKNLTKKLKWGAELIYESFRDDIGLEPSINNFQLTLSLYY